MPLPLAAIGMGLSGLGAIGKFFSGLGQGRAANQINPVWQQYQTSPFAKMQLGMAQQLFGGRMPGASAMEKNIASNQADTVRSINRGATDASQALALAGAAQGASNEAYSNLSMQEAQNKQAMLQNLNNAYGTMIGEGDKEYNSMLQKFQMDAQRKDALKSASAQNKYGALSDLSSMFMMGDQMGWFKKNGGASGSAFTPNYSNVLPRLMNQPRYNPITGKIE